MKTIYMSSKNLKAFEQSIVKLANSLVFEKDENNFINWKDFYSYFKQQTNK